MTISRDIKRQLGQAGALPRNWLFLGVGYTAKALINVLPDGLNLMGTSRSPQKWPDALKARVKGIDFQGAITDALKAALKTAEVLIISLPPSRGGDPFLSGLKKHIAALMPNLKWAGYLSATSVYGNRYGQWAFEDELLRPTTARGVYRAEAEIAWLETGLPVHIFRLAGIYGATYFGQTRNPFARINAGTARAIIKPDHIVNRIHVEDIVTALLASIATPDPLRIYNLSDGRPAPPQDVLSFAARLCSTPIPPRVGLDSPDISEMARSFYTETKRVSNMRAQTELGWAPKYPNYQTGLMSIYKSKHDQSGAVMLAGHVDVPAQRRRAMKDALARHIRLSRAEKGCIRFDLAYDPEIETRLHLNEIFESQAAFETHQKRTAASDWAEIARGLKRHYYKI